MWFWLIILLLSPIVTLLIHERKYNKALARWKNDKLWHKPRRTPRWEHVWVIIPALVAFALLGALPSYELTRSWADDNPSEAWEEDHWFSIIASADGSLTSGSWGIFGGQIDETPMYFFYRGNADVGIRQGHIPVDKTRIFEDISPGESAYIVRFKNTGTPDDVWWDDAWTPWFGFPDGGVRYEIHVPPGAVRQQHNFDLE